MAFTLYGGRATWDHAGKAAAVNAPASFELFDLMNLLWVYLF
jgi:hypothetical protein